MHRLLSRDSFEMRVIAEPRVFANSTAGNGESSRIRRIFANRTAGTASLREFGEFARIPHWKFVQSKQLSRFSFRMTGGKTAVHIRENSTNPRRLAVPAVRFAKFAETRSSQQFNSRKSRRLAVQIVPAGSRSAASQLAQAAWTRSSEIGVQTCGSAKTSKCDHFIRSRSSSA